MGKCFHKNRVRRLHLQQPTAQLHRQRRTPVSSSSHMHNQTNTHADANSHKQQQAVHFSAAGRTAMAGVCNPKAGCVCDRGSVQQIKAFLKLMGRILFCGFRRNIARSCKLTASGGAGEDRQCSTVSNQKKEKHQSRRMKIVWLWLSTLAPKCGSPSIFQVKAAKGDGMKSSNRQAHKFEVQSSSIPRVVKEELSDAGDAKSTRRVTWAVMVDQNGTENQSLTPEKQHLRQDHEILAPAGTKDQSICLSKCMGSSSFSFQPKELSSVGAVGEVKCVGNISDIRGAEIISLDSSARNGTDPVGSSSLRIIRETESCEEMVKEVDMNRCCTPPSMGQAAVSRTNKAQISTKEFVMSPTFGVQTTAATSRPKERIRRMPSRLGAETVPNLEHQAGFTFQYQGCSHPSPVLAPQEEKCNNIYYSKLVAAVTDNFFQEAAGQIAPKSIADKSEPLEVQQPICVEVDEGNIHSKKQLREMECKAFTDIAASECKAKLVVDCNIAGTGNGQKQQQQAVSHESDDYQSDISTDLFEIERLDGLSCCSSAPSSPNLRICLPIASSNYN